MSIGVLRGPMWTLNLLCVCVCVCVAVWFKFVGVLPKFCLLRLAVRPAGGRGGAPGKLSSGCLLFPARVVLFHFS